METILPQSLKAVYDSFQDEVSRMIFRRRLCYFLDRTPEHLDRMLADLLFCSENQKDSLLRLRGIGGKRPGEIALFGCGAHGAAMPHILSYFGLSAECFYDSDPAKWGTAAGGLPVFSPEKLIREYHGESIMISTADFEEEVRRFLLRSLPGAEKNILSSRVPGIPYPEYFIPEFVIEEDEVFIDGGCFDGQTSLDFLKRCCGKYKKIYAFEPDPLSFAAAEKNLAPYPRTLLLQKGLWNEVSELSFFARHDQGSHVAAEGGERISAVSIDEIAAGEKVTFIKLDVEGAELRALQGARDTIRAHKPKLAICVYHKPEDILTVPLYLRELVPEYKMLIRHNYLSYLSTVLYAAVSFGGAV